MLKISKRDASMEKLALEVVEASREKDAEDDEMEKKSRM